MFLKHTSSQKLFFFLIKAELFWCFRCSRSWLKCCSFLSGRRWTCLARQARSGLHRPSEQCSQEAANGDNKHLRQHPHSSFLKRSNLTNRGGRGKLTLDTSRPLHGVPLSPRVTSCQLRPRTIRISKNAERPAEVRSKVKRRLSVLGRFNATRLLCFAFWRVMACMWSGARLQSRTQPPSHVTPYL